MSDEITTDVLVTGAGPCGITLANLLGIAGVRTTIIDAEADIYEFPRAVGIDDESLRTYQTIGVVDRLLEDIVQNTPIRYYTSWGRLMAHVEPTMRPFGWPRRNNFLQPLFEATLRQNAAALDSVTMRAPCSLVSYSQDEDGVVAQLEGDDGAQVSVRARYLVGTDGGRSTVRRLTGITMTGSTAPMKWLVVDVVDDELDAPYSAVYCDPVRPVLMVPLPYGHRRFEFKITDSDDEQRLTDPDWVLRELIAPRYRGLPLPRVLRATIYYHHSRICSRFQEGRVFLAGDAAHLQPPFFGQGMNSGIRDVTNLAWKLALVLTGHATPRLLETYDSERGEHAAEMVTFATRIGQMYSPHNHLTERVRAVAFSAAQRIPGARDYILQMKYKPMPRYVHGAVLAYAGDNRDSDVGRMFNQPRVETASGDNVRLDDAIGPRFAVLGIHHDPSAALSDEAVGWWRSIGASLVHVAPPRRGPGPDPGQRRDRARPSPAHPAVQLEDVDGAFRDWLLRRPGDDVIILRPDRYVAAVCSRSALESVTGRYRDVLGGG